MMTFYAYAHLRPDFRPFYIGKGRIARTKNFTQRNAGHKRVVAKYGAENIIIETMPCRSEAEAFLREMLAIKALRLCGVRLANITDGGDTPSGFKRGPSPKRGIPLSAEQRAKMSAKAKGRRMSDAAKAKLSLAFKGRKKTEATLERMRDAARLRWDNPEVRERMVLARRARAPYTEASKQKMSASQRRRHAREKGN